jgi:Zn-dependent protease
LTTCGEATVFLPIKLVEAAYVVPPRARNGASIATALLRRKRRNLPVGDPSFRFDWCPDGGLGSFPAYRTASGRAFFRRYDELVSQLTPRPEFEPDFRDYEPIHPQPGWKSWLRKLWAPIVAVIGITVKFGVFVFKFLGLFVSIGAYALIWGWKFGVGFVVMILIHELGHFVEARRQGLDASIPRFIPFIGAYVLIKNAPLNPMRNALVALAGPAAGGLAAAICWGIGSQTGSSLLHALAYAGFFLNLVNLIPLGILDGGAIWRAYKLAKAEPTMPLEAYDGAAVLLPGAGRGRAALILTMYLGLALLLALGMWGTHVPQHRL